MARTPLTLWPQADGTGRERVEQELAQFAALHLGPSAGAVVGLVVADGAVAVEDPHLLAAFEDEVAELRHQAGRLDRDLAVVVVDVEHAALRAGHRRGFGLVDRGRDAVDVQDAGQGESTEAGADDCDWGAHRGLLCLPSLVAPEVRRGRWQRAHAGLSALSGR